MSERMHIDLRQPEQEAISRAVSVLRAGGIVVYPTETLYGIGADPLNEAALARIQKLKKRTDPKPMLLVTSSMDVAMPYVTVMTPHARRLIHAFWPGPLTLVFPAKHSVSHHLTHGTGTVGFRIPSSIVSRQLVVGFGAPITSTSANVTGKATPADIDGIKEMLGDTIDLYLDAGPLPPSPPSTVVDVSTFPPRLIREGAITLDKLRAVVPDISS